VFFILLAIFASSDVFSDEAIQLNETYQISENYRAGNTLIYDCLDNHYACVNELSMEKCNEDRSTAIKKKLAKYPCAVLKTFPKKEDCLLKNYQVLHADVVKRFCYLDRLHH
jgi:hypothetical protein